jgi:hypothetical protein
MKGDNFAALAAFAELWLSPQHSEALKGEAQLLYEGGDHHAAPVLEQILKTDPDNLTAQKMLGLIQAKADECSSATKHFELSKEAMHAHAVSLERYGYCLARSGYSELGIRSGRGRRRHSERCLAVAPSHCQETTRSATNLLSKSGRLRHNRQSGKLRS